MVKPLLLGIALGLVAYYVRTQVGAYDPKEV